MDKPIRLYAVRLAESEVKDLQRLLNYLDIQEFNDPPERLRSYLDVIRIIVGEADIW